MKKVIAILLVLAALAAIPKATELYILTDFVYDGDYIFYCSQDIVVPERAVKIDNGVYAEIRCSSYYAGDVRARLNNVAGESISYPCSDLEISGLIERMNITVKSEQNIDGYTIIYGYTHRLNTNKVRVAGEEINIQLAYKNGKITIGTPLILGSY